MNIILFEEAEASRPLGKRDARAAHLVKVLHKKAGDEFDAGVLGGRLGKGRIERLSDGGVEFSLRLTEYPPPCLPITVAVGFPRPIQARRLLRGLSNLGVAAIHLVGTELGDRNYRKTTLLTDGGARAALIEGAVQARDTRLPSLEEFPSLEDWLQREPPPRGSGTALLACDNVEPEASLYDTRGGRGVDALVIAVGSERGWSDAERRRLADAGFTRVSLGDRALRTETACIAAVAAARAVYLKR